MRQLNVHVTQQRFLEEASLHLVELFCIAEDSRHIAERKDSSTAYFVEWMKCHFTV